MAEMIFLIFVVGGIAFFYKAIVKSSEKSYQHYASINNFDTFKSNKNTINSGQFTTKLKSSQYSTRENKNKRVDDVVDLIPEEDILNQKKEHEKNFYKSFKIGKEGLSKYQKGKLYEEQIGEYYESIGYDVIYHGKQKGKKDKGIDLIATRDQETLLIQCKNWENSIVKQKHLKEFYGNCILYMERNPYINIQVKKVFITSGTKTNYGVMKFMQEHYQSMEYKIIPFVSR